MSTSPRQQVFGKRRPSAPSCARAAAGSTARADGQPKTTGRAGPLELKAVAEAGDLWFQPEALVVRWSARAAFLSGLVTACLAAGLLVVHGGGGGGGDAQQAASKALGINTQALGPALLLLSVWEAGQATFGTLVAAQFVLRRMAATSLGAYACGGALASLAFAAAGQAAGFGAPDHGYFAQAAIGACAGFFYRLFAGARPAPAKTR